MAGVTLGVRVRRITRFIFLVWLVGEHQPRTSWLVDYLRLITNAKWISPRPMFCGRSQLTNTGVYLFIIQGEYRFDCAQDLVEFVEVFGRISGGADTSE